MDAQDSEESGRYSTNSRSPRIRRILAYPSAVALFFAAAILTVLPQQSSLAVIKGDQPTEAPPYVAYLQRTENGLRYACSGTLIAPNLVLSAKHCGVKDTATIGSSDAGGDGGETRRIVKNEPFPGDDDVTIYVLESSVSLPPIAVWSGDIGSDPEVATLYGYGINNEHPGGTTDLKLYSVDGRPTPCVGLTALDGDVCFNSEKAESAPCGGDSGAPIVIHDDFQGDLFVAVYSASVIPQGSDPRQCIGRPWYATRAGAEPIRAWIDRTVNKYNP